MRHPFVFLALATLGLTSANAQTTEKLSGPFIAQQAERLYSAIAQAVKSSGGDLNTQHVHLVIGFSTGHFAKDPTMAEAARLIASDLVQNHLVPDDQISAKAWEMNVWPHQGAELSPMKVSSSGEALAKAVQDLWPRSPQAGSEGGHDTEKVLAELGQEYANQPNTVLVLITNSAASAAGTKDQRTVGENDPAYQRMLTQWTRVNITNTSGATLQLPFIEGKPERKMDAIIAVPKKFQGGALERPRSDLLAHPASPKQPTPWLPILLTLLGLGFLVILGLRWWNSRPASTSEENAPVAPASREKRSARGQNNFVVKVADRMVSLQNLKPGDEVLSLYGPGFPVPLGSERHVVLSGANLPAAKLLTLELGAKGILVRSEPDIVVEGETLLPLQSARDYSLTLRGRASAKPGLPPRPFQTTCTISILSAEREA